MKFIETLTQWQAGELLQGKIMVGLGVILLIAFIAIFRSHNSLLKGALIPMTLMLAVLIGYGGYILQSRPAHVKQSVALYQTEAEQAINQEIDKHTTDNKAGYALLKVYPILALVALLVWLMGVYLGWSPFYKGMAIGFVALFMMTFVIDSGFVGRSEQVLSIINPSK